MVTSREGGKPGGRHAVPAFIGWVWRCKESLTRRFPRTSRFLAKHGILLLIAFFFLVYAALALLKHRAFQTHAYDLGIFDQAIYQYSRFEIGANTVRLVPCLLADHWHPSLFLFAPLYWLWPDVRMLLIAQALVCAVGVLPVYWIAKERLRAELPALALSFLYLSFWGMLGLIYFDFHPHVLYPPLIALAYYFVLKDRMAAYFLCLPFLLAIQEQVALTVFFLGIWLTVFRRKRLEGVVTMLVSAAWYLAVVQVFIPALNTSGAYEYLDYYKYLGDTPLEIGKYLLLHPWMAVKLLFWPYQKTLLLLGLFAPFLFLPLASGFTIVLLPDLLQRLFSGVQSNWEMSRHYNAVYAAVLIIATLEVLPRLYRRMRGRYAGRPFDFRQMSLALCVALVLLQLPLAFATSAWRLVTPSTYRLDGSARAGHRALASIPPDASVCAVSAAVPHLTHRDQVHIFNG